MIRPLQKKKNENVTDIKLEMFLLNKFCDIAIWSEGH